MLGFVSVLLACLCFHTWDEVVKIVGPMTVSA